MEKKKEMVVRRGRNSPGCHLDNWRLLSSSKKETEGWLWIWREERGNDDDIFPGLILALCEQGEGEHSTTVEGAQRSLGTTRPNRRGEDVLSIEEEQEQCSFALLINGLDFCSVLVQPLWSARNVHE